MFKYLKSSLLFIILFVIFTAINVFYLALMDVDIEIAIYPVTICSIIGLIALVIDYLRIQSNARTLKRISDFVDAASLPSPDGSMEEEYQRIINDLSDIYKNDIISFRESESDQSDYLNMWVHQIKNPIASMRLELEHIDSDEARRLKGELNRIEHYVEMVLVYSRLGSDTTDLLFEKVKVRQVASSSVKKFKENFISKGIHLDMAIDDDLEVLTDRKWLGFILDQYISNALKYTSEGRIRIYNEGFRVYVEDTGIGIRPEDINRVWEKGFTGFNGRTVNNSSGLGLYLVRKAADSLKNDVGIESPEEGGSRFFIDLTKKEDIYD